MTRAEIETRVRKIAEACWDDERAHGMQDDLYLDVLRAIAAGANNAAELAAAAMLVEDIDFCRWCA